MKVAIVHERLDVVGGAEKVILALHRLYPEAPIFTSFVEPQNLSGAFRDMDIRTSYMQKLPNALKERSDKLLPLYMLAFQDFDLTEYDVVISSSYVAAKSVLTPSSTCHVCYCYTPMRFAWDLYPSYIAGGRNHLVKAAIRLMLQYFRMWDVQTSHNVDYFIGISETIRQRIRKHYRRQSEVIYPPVETRRFRVNDKPGDAYLVVSRLVPYKRIDLAVEAFNRLGRELIVIGTGRERKRLEALAKPNVRFLGWQSDEAVAKHLSEARALIFPGEEDFGILPVEAQAAGTPVIAYGRGGALETIINNETGCFFREQSVDSVCEAVERFETMKFDRHCIARHARRFDDAIFLERMDAYVRQCHAEFQAQQRQGLAEALAPKHGVHAEMPLDLDAHAIVRNEPEKSPAR